MRYSRDGLNDGYSWKMYDQKHILGRRFPRSYYTCGHRHGEGCQAKKEIEQDGDDPSMFLVSYFGTHTCSQQKLQISQQLKQENQPDSLLTWDLNVDDGESTSHGKCHSEITSDFAMKSENSGNQQSQIHSLVSEQLKFYQWKEEGNQNKSKRRKFTGHCYGRMKEKREVIALLQSDHASQEHNVSVLSIVGAEGSGKTTFARIIYSTDMVRSTFDVRAWICSAEVTDAKDLLRAIIESITTISCDFFELSELQEIVKEEVMNKKYLIVLDNVLDGGRIFGSKLLAPLRFGAKGSKILVTAREKTAIDTTLWMTQSYELDNLSEKGCYRIVDECMFYDTDRKDHPELVEVANRMAPRCEGVPLAAKAIGGLLRANVCGHSVYDALNDDLWEPNKNVIDVSQVFRLSYSFLPEFLKKCLLYCYLFPKGYTFEKNYLIRLWMAQGYFGPQDNGEEEDIGRECLDELLCRSFLQRSRNPKFRKRYEMHDLVYDLLQNVSSRELQIKDYRRVHNVSFFPDTSKSSYNFEALRGSLDLQSLLLINKNHQGCGRKRIQIPSPEILSDLLEDLQHLKVLDLSFSDIIQVPDSIQKLRNLGYLALNNTNIRQLPASICSLYNLQTLELRDCAYLQHLPREISKLINLRYLETQKKSGFVGIPQGLGQLTKLHTLPAFAVAVAEEDEWSSGINELNNLVNLRGDLCIGGLKYVTNENEAKEANLDKKERIRSLTLQWSISRGEMYSDDEMDGKANMVFENLKPHENLKELIVRDYPGARFPPWIGNWLSNLVSLTLDNCGCCETLPPLGQITSLKHLLVRRMDSVRRIGSGFHGSRSVLDAFPSLETLKIWEMYNLGTWHGGKEGFFPRLRSLSISRCFMLSILPSFHYVHELTIHGGLEFPTRMFFPFLISLSIDGFQNVKVLRLPLGLSSIKKLEVKHCSQLSTLWGLECFTTLKEIKLEHCPILHLKSDYLPSRLRVVVIHQGCSLLSTWCPPGFHEENPHFGQETPRKLLRSS